VWKASTEMRRAAMNASGETGEPGLKSGGSSWSRSDKSGSGGPKGDLGGAAKSISNGESCASESWETEL
jgi:hypothetical protein